ncbi:EcoKI restriction-modification system protein HsdS [Marinomonas spartinae]|uniref:restriction endonuclease subunit S n=1 Tax=Marinomonas spartinae TaxID=1792290 RepID=UPI000808D1FD|nr:restriction endonuclease subunit S [Marinomonas spartinae]SBS34615.1 EcoKI restriction-modification system protein HsdS [Marinomonas spartinae]
MPKQSHSPIDNLITEHIDIWSSAIKRKSSSGRGSSKKIELYGIKKLRELILELAVRGKLVAQDPNDEPASVLLERIAKEKAQLVKEGKIKKPKKLAEISDDEKPFELPEGWEWARIVELAEVGPRNLNIEDESSVSFIPMPLISTKLDGSHRSELKQWKDIKKGYTHFADGDIAIAKITPCFENSKAAVFRNLESGVGAGTTELHVARPIPNTLNPQFVLLYLKAPMFLRVGETKMTGSAGQKRVPKDFFALNPLPFAPLAEQNRIVTKVNELMALCDQLEAQTESSLDAHQTLVTVLLDTLVNSQNAEELAENWTRISGHFDTLFTTGQSIDQLKQTILQLAVMGKLVPQDPNDEPASELLKRIATKKEELVKQKKIKKQKPLPPISDDEKPFQLPNGWEWCRLPEVGDLARGKSKHRPRNDPSLYIDGTVPLVQTGDVARSNGEINTFSAQYNEMGLKQSQLWPKGTLCITIAANIADTGILGFDACFPDSVVGFSVLDDRLSVNYFDYFIRTAKANLEKFAPSTAQKNINLEILISLLVPCPAVREHSLIVAKVDQLMAICDQLKARLSEAQTTQLNLADALVEQAL